MRLSTLSRDTAVRAFALALIASACADAPTEPSTAARTTRPALALGAATYQALDLGALLANGWSAAYDINNNGVIVGSSNVTTALPQQAHAIRWTPAFGLEDIGTGAGHDHAAAYAINDNGWITGSSYLIASGGARVIAWSPPGWSETWGYGAGHAIGADNAVHGQQIIHGFRQVPGGTVQLLPLPAGAEYARVNAVNDLGVAVGSAFVQGHRAVRWTSAGVTVLPTLVAGQTAEASGINDAGVIVGHVRNPDGGTRAVRWLPNGVVQDLGLLPGDSRAEALDINDAGEIVGLSASWQGVQAFRWTEGTGMQALPHLNPAPWDPRDIRTMKHSTATAINDHGDIVGYSVTVSGQSHATVWRQTLNRPPVANAGGPYAGLEGAPITFNAVGSTDPDGDALTYVWNFNDDSPLMHGRTVSRSFTDNGTYYVTLTVTDPSGESSEHEVTVTITNVAPTIRTIVLDMGMLNRPRVGQVWPLTVRWTDPGALDAPWQWTIEWGDGTSSSGVEGFPSDISSSHAYATAGAKTARITIRDKDGAVATRTIPVSVQP